MTHYLVITEMGLLERYTSTLDADPTLTLFWGKWLLVKYFSYYQLKFEATSYLERSDAEQPRELNRPTVKK